MLLKCFCIKNTTYGSKIIKKILPLQFQQINTSESLFYICVERGHGGRVVTLSPPTSEAGVRFPARPEVGKLVVACRWSVVYSTET